MRTLRILSCVALVALATTGCVTRQTAKLDSAVALSGGSSASDSLRTGNAGVASAANGDNWTAANLFEQAQVGVDSPLNRFNLAAAYEKTGRSQQAAVLYRSVMVDGQYTKADTNRLTVDQGGAAHKVNLAHEAQRRLAVIEARNGAPASAEFGVGASASAFVGGPTKGKVSDARARQLDEDAQAASGE